MKRYLLYYLLSALLLASLLLAGCGGAGAGGDAPTAIEAYLQAMVEKDVNKMISLSCAAWEADAKVEYDSFAAVDLALEGLQCQEAGQEADLTLVSCSGKIIASYGAEDLVLDLAERPFKAVNEAGEWRMCGYR